MRLARLVTKLVTPILLPHMVAAVEEHERRTRIVLYWQGVKQIEASLADLREMQRLNRFQGQRFWLGVEGGEP